MSLDYQKAGTDKLIQMFNERQAELKKLDKLIRDVQSAEAKTVHRGWVVDKVVVDEVYQDTGAEVFYIYIRPCKRALREQKAHLENWGSITDPQKAGIQHSIAYMYMPQAGIIVEGGHGGYVVLKNADGRQPFDKRPIPCTPKDWEELKAGRIPSHMDNMNTETEEDF